MFFLSQNGGILSKIILQIFLSMIFPGIDSIHLFILF
jgi:hypothetical protein